MIDTKKEQERDELQNNKNSACPKGLGQEIGRASCRERV